VAVEHVGTHLGLGVHLLQQAGVAPVRRALASVEHAGRTELEGARAVGVDHRAPSVGGLDRLDDARVVLEEVVVGGQTDQVGVEGGLQAALDVEVVVGAALDPAGVGRADLEVEDGSAVLGVLGLAPDLDECAQPERLGVVLDDDRDLLHWLHQNMVYQSWQKINYRWHSCH
jgi:hypothetical protein